MTAAPAGGGLAEVLGLVAKATPGEFTVRYGVNIMAADGRGATNLQHNAQTHIRNEANAAALVAAVNYLRSHGEAIRELVAKSEKVASWLDRLARQAERHAQDTRFQSLADAAAADAKNFRETADDIRQSLLPFTTGDQP